MANTVRLNAGARAWAWTKSPSPQDLAKSGLRQVKAKASPTFRTIHGFNRLLDTSFAACGAAMVAAGIGFGPVGTIAFSALSGVVGIVVSNRSAPLYKDKEVLSFEETHFSRASELMRENTERILSRGIVSESGEGPSLVSLKKVPHTLGQATLSAIKWLTVGSFYSALVFIFLRAAQEDSPETFSFTKEQSFLVFLPPALIALRYYTNRILLLLDLKNAPVIQTPAKVTKHDFSTTDLHTSTGVQHTETIDVVVAADSGVTVKCDKKELYDRTFLNQSVTLLYSQGTQSGRDIPLAVSTKPL